VSRVKSPASLVLLFLSKLLPTAISEVCTLTSAVFFSRLKSLGQPGAVVYAYNPSYSGGRDQEGHGLKVAGANDSVRPYLKNT
jgi:hypothetical protein